MKIKLRFGDTKYWSLKEDWQFKARRNLVALFILSVIMAYIGINAQNYVGTATFSIIMFLLIAPQYYQYTKWQKEYFRNKYGVTSKETEEEK